MIQIEKDRFRPNEAYFVEHHNKPGWWVYQGTAGQKPPFGEVEKDNRSLLCFELVKRCRGSAVPEIDST